MLLDDSSLHRKRLSTIPDDSLTTGQLKAQTLGLHNKLLVLSLDREPRTVIHVKRAKRFDPMG